MARNTATSRARGGRGGPVPVRGSRGRGAGTGSTGFSQHGQGLQEHSSQPESPQPPDDEIDIGELSIDMENLTVMCYLSQEMIHVSSVEEMADQLVSTLVKTPSPLCFDILIPT